MTQGKITILGINGHVGHHAARAFVAAGWDVTGFGRSNRHPVAGLRFVKGDAESVEDMRRAIGDSEVVLNALNLPYHQWDKGRYEALTRRVIEAMGTTGRTLLFPANIYNYAATSRVLTPDVAQDPARPRGEIRRRTEALYAEAARRGDMQVVMLRAGDFYGPESAGDWYDQVIMPGAGKGRVAIPGKAGVGHAWAYLPDMGRAFEVLAQHRAALGPFENFHFAGHFVSPEQLSAAIVAAAPVPVKPAPFSWFAVSLAGVVSPLLREIVKMSYLWEYAIELRDPRLDALLGPGFGTPFAEAVRATVEPYFAKLQRAA